MAIQLHEGENISLGKLLLASLYLTLGDASSQLKSLPGHDKGLSLRAFMTATSLAKDHV